VTGGESPSPPFRPGWLSFYGIGPFVGLAIAVPFTGADARAALIQCAMAYAGVVVGFSGGVRWGAELVRAPNRPEPARLAAAGLMTVPATAALLLSSRPAIAIGLLALAGLVQLGWDVSAARSGLLPAWTLRFRIGQTLIGLACLVWIGFCPAA
jgi:hypothetical protein